MKLQMVDLQGQYQKLREEINTEIQKVLDTAAFINGPKVREFTGHLADYCGVKHVIPCGNGTDALQIALMSFGLQSGDKISLVLLLILSLSFRFFVPCFAFVYKLELYVKVLKLL